MNRKTALLALPLILVFAAAASWFLLDSPEQPQQSTTAPALTPEPPQPLEGRVRVPLAPPEVEAAAEPAPDPEVEPEAPVEEAPKVAAGATRTAPPAEPKTIQLEPGEVLLRGTVVVKDPQGVEHRGESGKLSLVLWRGDTGQHKVVQVTDGAWEAAVPEDIRLGFTNVELGGRAAVVDDRDPLPIPEQGRLELLVRWPSVSVLRVKASDTGQDLDQLEVVGRLRWPQGDGQHPGSYSKKKVLFEGTASPIELPSREHREVYFARAPGYAWGRIEIDHRLGGERILVLEQGAGLDVTIRGLDTSDRPVLRLRPGTAAQVHDQPVFFRKIGELTGEKVSIDDLPAGPYTVSVEVGEWFRKPVLLGTGTIELMAGQRVSLELVLKEAPKADKVTLAGTLVVPPEWEQERPMLIVELLDTPLSGSKDRYTLHRKGLTPVPGEEGTYTWRLTGVQAGRYEIGAHKPPFTISLEVPPEGLTDARIVVPPPGRVSLRTVDAETGGDAKVQAIHWHPKRPRWVSGGGLENASRDPETGRIEFRAPQGEIEVSMNGTDHQMVDESHQVLLQVGEGVTEHTLTVRRTCGFILILKDGETTVPWDWDWSSPSAKQVDGEGRSYSWGGVSKGFRITVTGPGSYRMTLKEIDGFQPIPEQVIQILPGEHAEHVVNLIRQQ